MTRFCFGIGFLMLFVNLGFASPRVLTAATISQDQEGFSLQLFLSDEVQTDYSTLPFDEKNQMAARFFIDLYPATTSDGFLLPQLENNQWIQNMRMGQNSPEKLRLVLDLTSLGEKSSFNVSKNEKGVLIAAKGEIVHSPAPTKIAAITPPKTQKTLEKPKQSKKSQYRIVIDPGHGGADPGARGVKGAKEKDVVLSISKKLKSLLAKDAQYTIFMTRENDKTLKLLERTRFANTKNGDLFVSIHANASPRASAKGVSTYFLNNADDQESLRVAMRENGELDPSTLHVPSGSDDYYLEIMKASMIKNFHTTQSTDLARMVQKNMIKQLSSSYSSVVDLGVRSARFYVLTGAKMPAILVETSFISNPTEEKRLTSSSYQDKIAKSVFEGIEKYIEAEEKNPSHQ